MKNPLKLALMFVILLINVNLLIAQPEQDEDIDDVPIDAGISLLTGAGILYGVRNLNRKNYLKKISKENEFIS